MVNLVSEEGDQEEEAVEPSESVPESEVITEADVGSVENILSTEPDFSPCENEKVLSRLQSLHATILKIPGVSFYRCPGASSYNSYQVPVGKAKKSIIGIHFSKRSARITLKNMVDEKAGKDISVKVTESGLTLDGESISQKEVLKRTREYRKARGWV